MEQAIDELTDRAGYKARVQHPDRHEDAYSVWLGDLAVGIGDTAEEALADALEQTEGLVRLKAVG